MIWFYTHCVIALVIFIADKKGTLEPTVNKFEEKIGIKTELPSNNIEAEPDSIQSIRQE